MNDLLHLPALRDRRIRYHILAARCHMRGDRRRCNYWTGQAARITGRIDRLLFRVGDHFKNMALTA